MANTWRAVATGITWATAAKSMLRVFNASGSGVVLRVYRIWVQNNQTVAVSGVLPEVRIVRLSTTGSGGVTVTPVAHDTSSTALPAQVTSASGDTTPGTIDATFRRALFSGDEPIVGGAATNNFETLVPLCVMWDGGYDDSNIEPIVLREGFGVSVYCPGIASAAGNADFIIEFTST